MSEPNPQGTAVRLKRLSRLRPTLAIVLGSGFQHVLHDLKVDRKVSYESLPGFPPVGVSGHAGELYFGRLGTTPALVLSGRAHFYEGHSMARVTFAIRTLAAFGVRDVLLTNAAGGMNRRFRAGDFMVLTDHINFMGTNPLRGERIRNRSNFVDLTCVYDGRLRKLLHAAARAARIKIHWGVYLAVSGPSYETPAEIHAFRKLGADAVGMSTVPEAIVARQCGLHVAGLSCITNLAAGCSKGLLSHAEVLETGESMQGLAAVLLKNFVHLYGQAA
jgi:purine-nucleoside phosphorylase